jgi:hypothetical protein
MLEIVNPESTDLIDVEVDIVSILLSKYCHFFASSNQLTGIKSNTTKSEVVRLLLLDIVWKYSKIVEAFSFLKISK